MDGACKIPANYVCYDKCEKGMIVNEYFHSARDIFDAYLL